MSQEEKNGVSPDPTAHLRLNEDEWKRYCADLEAKWTPHLTDEEWEQVLDARWAETDPEVQEQYEDKVVAVRHRRIIASGEEMLKVLEEAERITGLPRQRIAVTTIYGPKHFFPDS